MTRDLLARICAVSFGTVFCAALYVWWSDAAWLRHHVQQSWVGMMASMGIAVTAACTLLGEKFVIFMRKHAREEGRWQIMLLLAILVAGVCVLFVVGLQAPFWLPALLVAPFVLAFVCPGFAFWRLEDDPVPTYDDEDASAGKIRPAQSLSDFSKLQRFAALAVVLFILWTVSHAQFYERADPSFRIYTLQFFILVSFSWVPKWWIWLTAPLVLISKKLGVRAIFTAALCFSLAFSIFIFAKDALPYALTKRFGTDTQYEAEVRGRAWYPTRLYCKGELEISARRGSRDFDRCFDHPSDYPGFEVGTQVHVTLRESFAGRYVTEMRVAK